MKNSQIIVIKQKIERLKVQLEYLENIERLKNEQEAENKSREEE